MVSCKHKMSTFHFWMRDLIVLLFPSSFSPLIFQLRTFKFIQTVRCTACPYFYYFVVLFCHNWSHKLIFSSPLLLCFFFRLPDSFWFNSNFWTCFCLLCSILRTKSKRSCSKPVALTPKALHALTIVLFVHFDVSTTVGLSITCGLGLPSYQVSDKASLIAIEGKSVSELEKATSPCLRCIVAMACGFFQG